jgi:hypothetical protein
MDLPLSGYVFTATGIPLERAVVRFEWTEIGDLNRRASIALTDAKGRFSTLVDFYPWREAEWFWQNYRCDRPPPLLNYKVEARGYVTQQGTVQSKSEGSRLRVSMWPSS